MILRIILVCLALAVPGVAQAACSVSATGVAFGIYDTTAAAPDDATGTISVSCTPLSGLAGYTVSLSTGSSGSYTARRMASGGSTLNYNLYSDAARTQVWGNGSGGTDTVGSFILLAFFGGFGTHQVYGRIPARQAADPGSYADTIIVTVTY